MKIKAIQKLNPDSQRQITDWTYEHIAALGRAQGRYLTLSLVAIVIGFAFLADSPETVGYGNLSVSSRFFILWFPVVLNAIAWGLMGSLAQTHDAWPRLLELLDLESGDLDLYDIDPKPSFADHVTFLPTKLKSRVFREPLRFLSSLFYDLGYWGPVILGWYILIGVMPAQGLYLGEKLRNPASIVVLLFAIPATFFGIRTFWRRHIRKWFKDETTGKETMINLQEKPEISPLCPHCGEAIGEVYFQELSSILGRRYIYFCSRCSKILGVSHRKGFWMG